MGLDAETMVATIAGGASGYLVEFLPIGAFVVGLVLAFGVMEWLIERFEDFGEFKKWRSMNYERSEFWEIDYDHWRKEWRKRGKPNAKDMGIDF